MEATWMKRDCIAFFAWRCFPREFELSVRPVPQTDVAARAGDYELLAQADVHTCDRLIVERTVHVITPACVRVISVEGQVHLEELVAPVDIVKHVFFRCEHHLTDRLGFNLHVSRVVAID